MENNISFSQFVKEELVSNEYTSLVRKKALLSAFIKINGTLSLGNNKYKVTLKSENGKIAKFIYSLINELFKCDVKLSYSKGKKSKTSYHIEINNADELLDTLKISFIEGKISRELVYNDDTISGYLAGAFLASGSINSPKTSNYHLEIAVNDDNYSKWLAKVVGRYRNSDVHPKVAQRRDKYVIYIKASASIADFLIMIGAANSCMEFENIRVDRDFVNSANRLANLDMANMSRTLSSANRQIEDIKLIKSKVGLDVLKNKKAIELAKLRLENESASFDELALLLSKKMDVTIGKSAINHIFRKIHVIADGLK